jgi:hypothetical protein
VHKKREPIYLYINQLGTTISWTPFPKLPEEPILIQDIDHVLTTNEKEDDLGRGLTDAEIPCFFGVISKRIGAPALYIITESESNRDLWVTMIERLRKVREIALRKLFDDEAPSRSPRHSKQKSFIPRLETASQEL